MIKDQRTTVSSKVLLESLQTMQERQQLSFLAEDLNRSINHIKHAQLKTVAQIYDSLPISVFRALNLFLCGYFSQSDGDSPQAAIDDARPDDTGGTVGLSTVPELPSQQEIEGFILAPAVSLPSAPAPVTFRTQSSSAVATFLFLADPQISSAERNNDTRVAALNELNTVLNGIGDKLWPNNFNLDSDIVGTAIGTPAATFFGGDMCQTGGNYNAWDQLNGLPCVYIGGYELQKTKNLFDNSYPAEGLTQLNAGAVFFGLGNHDLQSEYTPAVGWSKGCLRTSTSNDYWRWQMWNFICQKHRGVFSNCFFSGHYPPTSEPAIMDALSPDSNQVFYWHDHSLSYMVDLGPVDVYQLHRFGGDTNHDHANVLPWLSNTLASRGTRRPVVIVQHYDFSSFSIPDWWTEQQRDALLTVIQPYPVIAFLMGHDHSPYAPIPFSQPVPNGTKTVDEFRPGAAFLGNFAVLRVTDNTLNIMQGSSTGGVLQWSQGYSKSW